MVPAPTPTARGDVEDGRTAAPRLLDAGATAILAFNDMVAVSVLLACRDLGLRVLADVSVFGVDGLDLAEYVTPPLTTVAHPIRRLGHEAMRAVLDADQDGPVRRELAPTLVVRGSTGRPSS